MKSTCVSTSQRTMPLTVLPRRAQRPPGGTRLPLPARYRGWFDVSVPRASRLSLDELEPGVRAEPAPRLRGGAAVREDDVCGEVVRAANQRRAHAVGVDRHAALLELTDLLGGEPAGDDDLHPLEAVTVERLAHARDQPS